MWLLLAAPAAAKERGKNEPALGGQIEAVRRELRAFGAITEYAAGVGGEVFARRAVLETGRDACEWVLAVDYEAIVHRVSHKHSRSTMTFDLAGLDAASVSASPVKERPWCCERSAEVVFATRDRRQAIFNRRGASWYGSERGWLHFSDAGAAKRAAAALAEAIRLCRRPGA